MKSLVSSVVIGLLLSTSIAGPIALEASEKNKKASKHGSGDADTRHEGAEIHVVFTSREIAIIREHYAPRYRNLPPGLRKKVARGGALPPGWQKKYEPFPDTLERRLGRLSPEYRRGVFDGQAVIYDRRSNVVIDVAVLF